MNKHSGAILIVDEELRRREIEDRIDSQGEFTDALSSRDWRNKQKSIFLLSLEPGKITYAALATVGNRVATAKQRIRFSDLISFDPPINFKDVQKQLDSRLENYFIRSSSGFGSCLPPRTWEATLNVIKNLRPEVAAQLDDLEQMVRRTPEVFKGYDTVIEERDAVNLCMQFFKLDTRLIREMQSPVGGMHFLQGVSFKHLNEDQIINNDAQVFGDWARLRQYQSGEVVFTRNGQRLVITNVNRTSVEKTAGVDLIYYRDRFDSYVLVQYKRLQSENGKLLYRPFSDSNYQKEIDRMHALSPKLLTSNAINHPDSYRLNEGSFYFKLCNPTPAKLYSPGLISGMYFPLDYWDALLSSQLAVGPRKGKVVSNDNCGRHLTNQMFIDLVQEGWVGTKLDSTQVNTLITDALDSNKSIILARQSILPSHGNEFSDLQNLFD